MKKLFLADDILMACDDIQSRGVRDFCFALKKITPAELGNLQDYVEFVLFGPERMAEAAY
jgi:hypothetical protein